MVLRFTCPSFACGTVIRSNAACATSEAQQTCSYVGRIMAVWIRLWKSSLKSQSASPCAASLTISSTLLRAEVLLLQFQGILYDIESTTHSPDFCRVGRQTDG